MADTSTNNKTNETTEVLIEDNGKDALSLLNQEFKKAKIEQILRFLEDQEQINKRFSEFKLNSDDEEACDQGLGLSSKEKYERQLEEINNRVPSATSDRPISSTDLNEKYDTLDNYRSTSRYSKVTLGQSRESMVSLESNVGTDSPVPSANIRRRRYRTMQQPMNAAKPVHPMENAESVLMVKTSRPKSAYGHRKAPAVESDEAIGDDNLGQEQHYSLPKRSQPEGAEQPKHFDQNVFAQSFRNPFMFVGTTPYRPPSRVSWDVVSDSVNVVRGGGRPTYAAQIDSRPTGLGNSNRRFKQPAFVNPVKRSTTSKLSSGDQGIENLVFPEFSKTSSSNDSTETFDREDITSRNIDVREMNVGLYLSQENNTRPPQSGLHRIIQWAPQNFNGRPLRRYISYDSDRPVTGVHKEPPRGSSVVQKTKAFPDLRGIRSKSRPIVFKLPPLEASVKNPIGPELVTTSGSIVGTSTRTTTIAEPTVGGY